MYCGYDNNNIVLRIYMKLLIYIFSIGHSIQRQMYQNEF